MLETKYPLEELELINRLFDLVNTEEEYFSLLKDGEEILFNLRLHLRFMKIENRLYLIKFLKFKNRIIKIYGESLEYNSPIRQGRR